MVCPQRALVVPRALSPECGYALALEEMIAEYLGLTGPIAVFGPPGAGKTTALRHLAAVLPESVLVLDDLRGSKHVRAAGDRLVVYARAKPLGIDHVAKFELARWGNDEILEYLMAAHRDRCGPVMARLTSGGDVAILQGNPELLCAVLDFMAKTDGEPPAIRDALGEVARTSSLRRHAPVRVFRVARMIEKQVREGGECKTLRGLLPRDAIDEAARRLRPHARALRVLREICSRSGDKRQPMAASLLHALGGWRPDGPVSYLFGAYLDGVAWPRVHLAGANLAGADLRGADLEAANLSLAHAIRIDLTGARLHGATLSKANLGSARLERADLSHVRGSHARFAEADLRRATAEGALLVNTRFDGADLRGARFNRADLASASLQGATVASTDFSRANLDGANLRGGDLRHAVLTGARFTDAKMGKCRLDGVRVPGALLERAMLTDASLTASSMPGASMRGANLRGARVADVDWANADLRDADLRRASFHMGSSRSGLVFSPYASEGTRTGFYTDDYEEQHFKAPEEIRKANLRGADLRGARVEDTDFYLVDLRDARYDREQEVHFRRCGAILRAKSL